MKKLIMFLFACAFVSPAAFAQTNTANVDQKGTDHFSGVAQIGANQTADITQRKSSNVALVGQYTDNDGPQSAEVIQKGDNNRAIVLQSQTGGGSNAPANTAYIEQLGSQNRSFQKELAGSYNSSQHVWGLQKGTQNRLVQIVEGGYNVSLRADQRGDMNESKQIADGAYINGEVIQRKTQNEATQKLYDLNVDALITQDGYMNRATQTFSGGIFSHTTDALIDQKGSHNRAWQYGNGYDLNASLYQSGDCNWSVQAQLGTDHSSTVSQSGHSNGSIVFQYN
ncbi:MAG TPA: hypothetical protein VFG39_06015 [Balneolaceae bacterium]|nr:hypothetical protein [Balneolaceae bacterium]